MSRIDSAVGLRGAGMPKHMAGRLLCSMETVMNGDQLLLSFKWAIICLVDAVTCPGMQSVSPLFDFNSPDIYRTGNPKISQNHSK